MTSSKNRNKGAKFYKRIPCPAVGPGCTRFVKEHPDRIRYHDEYYSPSSKIGTIV